MLKSSHRTDGKIAHTLALILACATSTDASINYRMYVQQRPRKFPSPRWDFHMFCALCLQGGGVYNEHGSVSFSSCTITGNTAYDVRAAETRNYPVAAMGFSHVLRLCLQGGGVSISSGTVSFSSCTITGNTATYVRAHPQNFPSPRWENC
jgi:hypothetical protein